MRDPRDWIVATVTRLDGPLEAGFEGLEQAIGCSWLSGSLVTQGTDMTLLHSRKGSVPIVVGQAGKVKATVLLSSRRELSELTTCHVGTYQPRESAGSIRG